MARVASTLTSAGRLRWSSGCGRGTLAILRGTDLPTDKAIFDVISAFGTVGLSTGITADLPTSRTTNARFAHVHRPGRHDHPGRIARRGTFQGGLPLSASSCRATF